MTEQQIETDNYKALAALPIPVCVVDQAGKIRFANELMKDVFAYKDIVDANFFALTGVKRAAFFDDDTSEIMISRNDNYFVLETNTDASEDGDIVVYFFNVTQRETFKESYESGKLALLYISIDNYDELISSSNVDSRKAVPTEVDRCIRRWADQFDASIESTGEDTYLMTVFRRDADRIIESRFQILDDVRAIDTKNDFPVSLSIGMGRGAKSLKDITELAEAAHELALGRGGDQAVVKDGDHTSFYGGKLMSYEKNNKGKSRIIAHALKQLILESDRVFIMGHHWPDMDCFGASLAAYRLCEYLDRDAYIVIEEYNDALTDIYRQAKDLETYRFINSERAISLCGKGALAIVVDTNRPSLVECPEVIEKAAQMVLIDHHRLSEDSFEGATLSYVETYASSASELMAEILQYSAPKRIITKFEAEAMLAGMLVDTNKFSIKTGVRTFEAAAWLRRAGADTTEVKRFFQTEVTAFQTRAEAIANAEYLDCGVALSITGGYSTSAQIINSQVADALLMVKGVKAAFVAGQNDIHTTVVSARSLGEVNVQVIMENFDGGGHLNSAGAQVDVPPTDFMEQLKIVLREYFDRTGGAGE
ncbi:MAG: DHH family phosphoesterase [Mogibacterium sp.]|nr:DHH family phosphoesterase [Mogibacterium sp.]